VYPANYGFIPHTLADDGDPLDILVIGPVPVAVGSVVRSRPIGVLIMEDDKGNDEKQCQPRHEPPPVQDARHSASTLEWRHRRV